MNINNLINHQQRLQKQKHRRKLWLKVHLWLGLSLGLILAVIGLTGSVLVFWREIDQALNSSLYQASASAGPIKSIDEMMAAAESAAPAGWVSTWSDAPTNSAENYLFGFSYQQAPPAPEEAESLTIAVDPYTAQVVDRRVFYHDWNPFKSSFVGFFFKLHYALFLGEVGVTIVGVLAVFFLVSVVTGMVLWWPSKGQWRRVLTIKRRASPERFNHDLHQTAGFYSLIVMLWLLVSGVYFNLPEQFKALIEAFSPVTADIKLDNPLKAETLMEQALQQAKQIYPHANWHYFVIEPSLFTSCYKDIESLKSYVLDQGCVVFNRHDGQVLQIKDPAHGTIGDTLIEWQWPLHSGQAFGWTGRILVFIVGLICPLLFVTGLIRWLQKHRAKSLRVVA
jgi:uncharacterized iron-regulated membrane protein